MNEKEAIQKLGELIFKIRKTKKISRKELAEMLGIDIVTMGRWERGDYLMPAAETVILSIVLEEPEIKKSRCRACPLSDVC